MIVVVIYSELWDVKGQLSGMPPQHEISHAPGTTDKYGLSQQYGLPVTTPVPCPPPPRPTIRFSYYYTNYTASSNLYRLQNNWPSEKNISTFDKIYLKVKAKVVDEMNTRHTLWDATVSRK